MVKPAASVPVAGRLTVVHPAGSGPVVCSLTALTIWGAVSAGASVPVPGEDDVAGDDEPPSGVPVVLFRSSTMAAAPAPAPSTASSTSTSHNPVRRLRGPAGAGAGAGRRPGGAADPAHGAAPGPAGVPC